VYLTSNEACRVGETARDNVDDQKSFSSSQAIFCVLFDPPLKRLTVELS
jgi:hypothetical protein